MTGTEEERMGPRGVELERGTGGGRVRLKEKEKDKEMALDVAR